MSDVEFLVARPNLAVVASELAWAAVLASYERDG